MAIITNALLAALQVGFKKTFQTAYDAQVAKTFYMDVCTVVPSSTSSETYGWLKDFPDMREWIGDRVVKDMATEGYSIVNKDYEGTVGVLATKIKDDQLGIYTPMMQHMGQSAANHPDKLTAALIKAGESSLCFDGQNFFDTDHPVFANVDGTGAATTVSNVQAGVNAPWYLLDTTRPLKPFIFQDRETPSFVSKTNPETSDSVFMTNKYMYGVSARRNVGYGFWQCAYQSKDVLNSDNLDLAIQAMMEFKADGGRPLGITPNLLVVPPSLRSAANKTVKVMLGDGGASNPNYEAVDVKVVPWLAA